MAPKPKTPKGSKATNRPAKKASTGTTYQATGINDPTIVQPQLDSEMGSSAGSTPQRVIELVPDLISPYQRGLTYARMMNDAGVDMSMRVQKTPILGADFYVDAYDDTPVNLEIAEFVCDNLMGGMNAPFLNSLEDILHFFEDGYAVLEKVYEMREWTPEGANRNTRQYTMLKKLGVRPPNTIKEIAYDDNGGPLTATQGAVKGNGTVDDVEIDISRLLMFTFARRGGDLTGKSLLRTAYPHWYYKTHFYKIDAVQKERHSLGIPRGKLLPGYTEQDKIILRQLLRNLRTNEEAFIMQTPNVEIDFAEVHGQLVNVLDSASHHNMMILLNVMALFMGVGASTSSGGGAGRASGATQSDMFMKSLKYIANYLCDVINMYLIPELVVWNYPTKSFPKLKVRNIGETRDLQMLGAALGNLLAQQGITMDVPTEDWIRETFDMPAKQADAAVTTTTAPPVAAVDNTGPPNGKQQKGAVKPTTATGNVGKAPASAN